ncbi:MAG TPA: glycosyltransferase family 4 protein [Steroidobacteraceae bacterium]|nr:glycosyltransferase family 4 protein [Steroidobacteraceae bacterium]
MTPKLVFVNRFFAPDQSATSRMVSDLARLLRASGHRVEAVCSRQLYDDAAADLPEREEIDGVVVHRVGRGRHGRGSLGGRALDYLGFHWAACRHLRRILEPGDVVIAKTDPPLLGVSVARAARARGALLVNWLQDVFPEVATELGLPIKPAFFERLLLALRDGSLRQAACNVAIGSRMRERLLARGITAPIRVIPNWVDIDEITVRGTAENPVRAELDLGRRFVIGYSGNLGRAHEFDTFLGAAQLLADSPEFVFLITGGGARMAALRAAVAARNLANFRFQSFQPAERLADSMAAADVHLVSLLPGTEGLIVPSKYYGIMAAGRPAIFIGDPDGELAREIRADDTGAVVAVGDARALAAELRSLHAEPARFARLAANARRSAEVRHSSRRALTTWLALFDSLRPRAADAVAAPVAVADSAPASAPTAARAQSGT